MLVASAALVIVVVAGSVLFYATRSTGGRNERAVVTDYIANLNAKDATGLVADLYPKDLTTARSQIASAKLPWNVATIVISHDFQPSYAVAELTGTQGDSQLHVYLTMLRRSGNWFVTIGAGPPPVVSPGPTAAATR